MLRRASFLLGLAGGLAVLSTAATAQGTWPSARPIRWIVPFPAGGATDIVSRLAAEQLGQALGQSIVVENVTGAAGAVGVDRLSRSPADGYTIGTSANSVQAVMPHQSEAPLPFDTIKSFTPLAGIANFQYVLNVAPASGMKSVADLIAKARATPGKVSFGSSGLGTGSHLAGILLAEKTGTKFTDVPYKGGAPALADLMGGHVDFVADPVGGSIALIRSGKLIPIAMSGSKRHPAFPEVPLVSETVPGYDHVGWFGLYGPAGMPPEIVGRIGAEMAKVQQSQAYLTALEKLGYEPWIMNSRQLADQQQKDLEQWRAILRPRAKN
ncbi:Bug family tripartite tricarboxylate transporter substrate binding protein [Hydrogenophaga sp. BPS33]|uniref:Bug family tripartite tricarboxylate transporter substrate binding protein n=1 Tax=Hydrogenophaga sp. BPS33 TaxID=2651974 RepID=UPI001320222D|nr:tripartite tricarboxylate transporter substrate binding protein [Hydrogenophaga sp. BPS33]QHE84307.1 tripartite tricarboxylate transporter substrate binding protein [Hydrogenophaga sp. BPS33]